MARQLEIHLRKCMHRLLPRKRHHDSDREDYESSSERYSSRRGAPADRKSSRSGGKARTRLKYDDVSFYQHFLATPKTS